MPEKPALNRRQFLAGSAMAAVMMMLGGEEIRADPPVPSPAPSGPPVGVAVIGLGVQGRALLTAISSQPGVKVVIVCDTYEPMNHRALEIAPGATAVTDYRQALDNKAVDAVFVATPTHLHRQIALDAVQAGKHVYLEAPIASTLDDARAIAVAGKGSSKIFQVGLQQRSNAQVLHVRHFVQTNALGITAQGRSQAHKRTSWRSSSPNPDRAKAQEWRLDKAVSTGIVGEMGIHPIDMVSWFIDDLPAAVSGAGAVRGWQDGRGVPDTVQAVFQYPGGVNLTFDGTIVSSFNGNQVLLMGTESSILVHENLAWMFKEADSPALGWEVYARKDKIMTEEGIALVADASKQLALGKKPGAEEELALQNPEQDALDHAVETFIKNVRENKQPDANAVEGYRSAVTVIKANEAIVSGTRVEIPKDLYRVSAT